MTPNSFNIGNPELAGTINSVDTWGLKVIYYHMLSPQKRPRVQQIPFRDGSYDYEDEYYNDRPLQIRCRLTRKTTEDEFDEIRYQLSRKNQYYFWDRPTKYYSAKLYEAIPVNVFQQQIMREFDLTLSCAPPFAIGPQITQALNDGKNAVNFIGTARTPTVITIKNSNSYAIKGIRITAARRLN